MGASLKSLAIFTLLSAAQAIQPSAPEPIAVPLRNLKWGQLNFLHTTDTHGWLAGHLQEYERSISSQYITTNRML